MKRRIIIVIAVAAASLALLWFAGLQASPSDEFVRLMNQGKGHIENRETEAAIEALERAVALEPRSAPALRNLARAHLIPRRAEHTQAAIELLTRAAAIEPDSVATQYLSGLALIGLERYEESVPFFERAVRLDPDTASLRYQLATALQTTGANDRAYEQLLETVRLEPLHTNAIYKLASHARRRGDRDDVVRLTREFQRLKQVFGLQPEDFFQRCIHLDPEPGVGASVHRLKTGATHGIAVRWRDATAEVFATDEDRAATTAGVLEVNEAGLVSLFVAATGGEMCLLEIGSEGRFERRVLLSSPMDGRRFTDCAVGDFYVRIPDTGPEKFTPRHHARNDVFLIGAGGAMLLERADENTLVDRALGSGLADATGRAAQAVDYDHNGVLDLLIAGDDGAALWQNNSYVVRIETQGGQHADPDGRMRFADVTEQTGIAQAGPAIDVAAIELDGNVAIDLVVAHGDEPTRVFMNQRAGRYAPMAEPPGPWPPARRVLADDLDNDGRADVVLIQDDHAVVVYGGGRGRDRFDFPEMLAGGGALVDYDNDGWLDFCAFGALRAAPDRGAVRFWCGRTGGGWLDTTRATGADTLSSPPIVDAIPADYDGDGDTDVLLLTNDDRMRLLANDGGNVNRQLKLRLVTILTNPTGLGNGIEVRAGDVWISRFVSRLPVEIGVGQTTQLDTLTSRWTNGVIDNEFLVSPAPQPLEVVEKMVELGSCPFLFAWTGERFRFVTDILGNSPLGLSIRRDEVLPADPDEIVFIGDAKDLETVDGAYVVEVAECYREVLYLDSARLIAVDHPVDVEVHPTDKLMPPPFPASELWAMRDPQAPVRVESDDGIDRTAALTEIDGVYAPPGPTLPPPFRGLCHPLTLTMDFGPLDAGRPLVLALTGWLRYGSASVNIAIAQNPALTVIPPTLEVETASGDWRPVDVVVGMPAGKTKTIVCDLTGKLPPDARRLRLTSTFEVRWDRIAICERRSLAPDRSYALSPSGADLYWRGFPEMQPRGTHHPITPDYHVLSDRPQWRTTPQGWCTRYGDVLELVRDRDDKFAIINGGDAVTLRFPADDLPPIPVGMTRSLFFHSIGWEKDADHNVVDGDTVEPYPTTDSSEQDWHLKYNTRWVPGAAFGAGE